MPQDIKTISLPQRKQRTQRIFFLILSVLSVFSAAIIFRLQALDSAPSLSVALIFESEEPKTMQNALKQALEEQGIKVEDESIVSPAKKALQFPNRQNLTRKQAQNLGQALGTDLFITARFQSVERIAEGGKLYGECRAAFCFAASRSGRLIGFDFIETQAESTEAAISAAVIKLKENGARYGEILREGYSRQFSIAEPSKEDLEAIELTDDPKEGFDPPSFLDRLQPQYTETARKLAVSATVDLEAVFRKDGSVGNVEIIRWAGYGLDESAEETVRKLRFKPAKLNGKEVSCRALIRYNFKFKN